MSKTEELIARAERLNRTGGLGYEAHDFLDDLIATLRARPTEGRASEAMIEAGPLDKRGHRHVKDAFEALATARTWMTLGQFESFVRENLRELGGVGFVTSMSAALETALPLNDGARSEIEGARSRIRTFVARMNGGSDWTGALLIAYNPTGSTDVPYEAAKAAFAADLSALAAAPASPISETVREVIEPGMIRVCPARDARCPHGMHCPFGIGENWHDCDMAASRAALRAPDMREAK